jgi:hypothetical protein
VTVPPTGGQPGTGTHSPCHPEADAASTSQDDSAAHRQLSHAPDLDVPGVKAALTPNAADHAGDTSDYIAFVRRILAALERRVAHADIHALAQLVELQNDLARHVEAAVAKLRHDDESPASWSDIGRAFGITRQAAQDRYGHVGGSRRPGGQPGNLR